MRYVTKEMLLDAVERKVPLFEDGDEFGDDVLLYMIEGDTIDASHKKYKHRKVLLRNVSSVQNPHDNRTLTWVTKCHNCGKEIRVPVSKTILCTQHDFAVRIGLRLNKCRDTISTEFNGKKITADYLGCLVLAGHRDYCFCHDCEEKVKIELAKDLHDYCLCEDKIDYWRSQIAKYGSMYCIENPLHKPSKTSLLLAHPYSRFCYSSSISCIDNLLTEIHDGITGNDYSKTGENGLCVVKPHRYPTYYQKPQSIESKQKPTQVAITARYKHDPKVSTEIKDLSATDLFIQKYCLTSRRNATINDAHEILSASNLNEPQLQSHLKAMFYTDFVKTIYWKSIVLRRKWMDSLVCCRCGTKNNLEVHHLTYDHHGDERHHFEDLTTLCRKCHTEVHAQENITRPH